MNVLFLVLGIAVVLAIAIVAVMIYARTRVTRVSSGSLLAPPATSTPQKAFQSRDDVESFDASAEAGVSVRNADVGLEESLSNSATLSSGEGGENLKKPGSGRGVAASADRLWKAKLKKARDALEAALAGVARRQKIDAGTWDALEEALLAADVGVKMTMDLVSRVEKRARAENLSTSEDLIRLVKSETVSVLQGKDRTLARSKTPPTVYLFAGVNGTGKTTSIAKLAKRFGDAGQTVVIAAADTFRAAATEQLEIWAKRVGAHVVKGSEGADPGAVVFDAIGYARAHGADYLLVDTAGRLHTNQNLMEELKKIARVASKAGAAPAETLLVIDATTGQNGLSQAARFKEAVQITGIFLTKLDGSARGGIVVAIEDELGVPVKLVGVGESADDLVTFDPEEFAEALFNESIRPV